MSIDASPMRGARAVINQTVGNFIALNSNFMTQQTLPVESSPFSNGAKTSNLFPNHDRALVSAGSRNTQNITHKSLQPKANSSRGSQLTGEGTVALTGRLRKRSDMRSNNNDR
jgi:hypothetical protein